MKNLPKKQWIKPEISTELKINQTLSVMGTMGTDGGSPANMSFRS